MISPGGGAPALPWPPPPPRGPRGGGGPGSPSRHPAQPFLHPSPSLLDLHFCIPPILATYHAMSVREAISFSKEMVWEAASQGVKGREFGDADMDVKEGVRGVFQGMGRRRGNGRGREGGFARKDDKNLRCSNVFNKISRIDSTFPRTAFCDFVFVCLCERKIKKHVIFEFIHSIRFKCRFSNQ